MKRSKLETLCSGDHVRLVRRGQWEFADRTRGSGVVAIVAVTERMELVLTEQFRPPVQMKVVDLPAGISGDIAGQENEARSVAARRELLEECGFSGEKFEFLTRGPTSAGLTSELIDFYLVRDAQQISEGGGDESESIKVHVVPLAKLGAWAKRKSTRKTCVDPKVFAAVGLLNLYTS